MRTSKTSKSPVNSSLPVILAVGYIVFFILGVAAGFNLHRDSNGEMNRIQALRDSSGHIYGYGTGDIFHGYVIYQNGTKGWINVQPEVVK